MAHVVNKIGEKWLARKNKDSDLYLFFIFLFFLAATMSMEHEEFMMKTRNFLLLRESRNSTSNSDWLSVSHRVVYIRHSENDYLQVV